MLRPFFRRAICFVRWSLQCQRAHRLSTEHASCSRWASLAITSDHKRSQSCWHTFRFLITNFNKLFIHLFDQFSTHYSANLVSGARWHTLMQHVCLCSNHRLLDWLRFWVRNYCCCCFVWPLNWSTHDHRTVERTDNVGLHRARLQSVRLAGLKAAIARRSIAACLTTMRIVRRHSWF